MWCSLWVLRIDVRPLFQLHVFRERTAVIDEAMDFWVCISGHIARKAHDLNNLIRVKLTFVRPVVNFVYDLPGIHLVSVVAYDCAGVFLDVLQQLIVRFFPQPIRSRGLVEPEEGPSFNCDISSPKLFQ